MSVKIMDRVWESSKAKGGARLVLLALADWAGDDGFCYPGLGAIVRKTLLTKSGVVKILKRLEATGELHITVRGHDQLDPIKDDPEKPGGWQVTNYYRVLAGQVGDAVYRPRKRTGGKRNPAEVVNPIVKGGEPDAAHIRKNRHLEPSLEPSEGPAQPASASADADGASSEQAFADLWNKTTSLPILRCAQLTSGRRRHIRKRLEERPLTEWARVFARIQASSFCRGENERGWMADFGWVIGSPDVAVKVLEGKYDDRGASVRAITAAERETARAHLTRISFGGACFHAPPCADADACVNRVALMLRGRRKAS